MARYATLRFDRRVFERERSRLVSVAIEAKLVLRRRRPQLACQETAVLVVAIGAVDQALIHAMMKRLGEIRFHVLVAAEAQLRLRDFEELCLNLRRVNGVAIHAADVVLQMLRAQKICMLLAKLVAAKAALG